MKSKDRFKEEIGLYKLLMTITSAIAISLIGWLFNNTNPSLIVILAMLATSIVVVAILFFLFEINTKIRELDL